MAYLLVLIGFAILIKGADIFVEGASSIAKRFHIPEMIIGLTIVAMGTSLPELSVSFISALNGQSDMSIANAIGSNIFNVLMILGVSAFIKTLPIKESSVGDILVLISATLLLFVLASFGHSLVWFDGLIMLCLFAYFIRKMIKEKKYVLYVVSLMFTILFNYYFAYMVCIFVFIYFNYKSIISEKRDLFKKNIKFISVSALTCFTMSFVFLPVALELGSYSRGMSGLFGGESFKLLFVSLHPTKHIINIKLIKTKNIFFISN